MSIITLDKLSQTTQAKTRNQNSSSNGRNECWVSFHGKGTDKAETWVFLSTLEGNLGQLKEPRKEVQ